MRVNWYVFLFGPNFLFGPARQRSLSGERQAEAVVIETAQAATEAGEASLRLMAYGLAG
jgi:hypothetical protein